MTKLGGTLHWDDGTPISQATVHFIPEGQDGKAASGFSGSDGSFDITTFNSGDGIAAGKYKVVVTKVDPKDVGAVGPQGPPQDADLTKLMKEAWMKKGAEKKSEGPASLLPAVYANPKTTPLQATIPGPSKIELKLKKA
ncbi:MAG TPA: hypothetical protein VKJ47_22045 [Candidatus Binatia bacterium]|nr:hypothetical protein [Candidatus Binatia bacterium]